MRITQSVRSESFRATNSGRNCAPPNDCKWVTTTTRGEISVVEQLVRSEIVRNPSVNGWRPPSAYTAEGVKQGILQGSYTWTGLIGYGSNAAGGSRLTKDGAIVTLIVDNEFTPPSSRDAARLKGKALSQLKDQQLDIGMALATRKQTADLIAATAARLARAYSAAKQRKFTQAAKELGIRNSVRPGTKSAASGWLQLQFGWMPLVNDIYGAYGLLQRAPKGEGDLVVLRVNDQSSGVVESSQDYFPYEKQYGGGKLKVRKLYRRDFKQSYWWKVNSAALFEAQSSGLTDPAVIAWDLVPFSFVVDWLLPVGQFLRNCTADLGFTYLGGSQTYFERRSVDVEVGEIIQGTDASYRDQKVFFEGAGTSSGFKMQRLTLPSPGAEMYLKNPFSSFTVITSLALLTQRFQSNTAWKQIGRATVRGG